MFVPPPHSYLSADETCVICTRRHWAALLTAITPVALIILTLIAIGVTALLTAPPMPGLPLALLILTILFVTVLLAGWVDWWEDHILVTDQRLLRVYGVLTIAADDMQLSKITDMTYRRPLLGRVLGYGTLRIESAGQKQSLERIDYLPDPVRMYREVQTRRAATTNAPEPASATEG
jgi:uncharacterized membrane protein YdbT with pleckstrin-like domain